MKHPSLVLFSAALLALPAAAQVKITPEGDKVSVEIAGKPFTTFYMSGEAFGAKVTKPYLWPLLAPSGTAITRSWPMENVPEEQAEKKDHQHQRGLWFAHDNVTVQGIPGHLDFWNNEWSYYSDLHRKGLGRMNLVKLDHTSSGKEKGTITATFEWTNMEGTEKLLTEKRVMTFYGDPKVRMFDVDITLTALDKPVTFGDGKDGAFGIRLRPVLQEDKGHSHITNADGLVGEKALWGKPSNWCDYSGAIGNETLGVAILDNPGNPNHPVRWHARAYGLFAANAFGVAAFTNDKSQTHTTTIEPGKSLRYRYRVIIHEGDVKQADIAADWKKYSAEK
ncbi:MAG: PmoA family protein [Acidobacteria bacterium]|nr:PmoA family protein [Acidobacteriota bacterium]